MRKVLTGPGCNGRSTILSDEPIAEPAPGESRAATEIWMTQALPPELPYVRQKMTEAAEMDVGIPLGTVHGIRVGPDGVVLPGVAIGIGRP